MFQRRKPNQWNNKIKKKSNKQKTLPVKQTFLMSAGEGEQRTWNHILKGLDYIPTRGKMNQNGQHQYIKGLRKTLL